MDNLSEILTVMYKRLRQLLYAQYCHTVSTNAFKHDMGGQNRMVYTHWKIVSSGWPNARLNLQCKVFYATWGIQSTKCVSPIKKHFLSGSFKLSCTLQEPLSFRLTFHVLNVRVNICPEEIAKALTGNYAIFSLICCEVDFKQFDPSVCIINQNVIEIDRTGFPLAFLALRRSWLAILH